MRLAIPQLMTLSSEFMLAPDVDYVLAPEPLQRGIVYLLHFDRPISDKHTTQHYIGWTVYLPGRIKKHQLGLGARLTAVAAARGIDFVVARTWAGDRNFERRLKNRHEGPRLCPFCNPRVNVEQRLAALDECL